MRKFCEENERTKRAHLVYLRDAKGQDEKSLDKVAAALLKFEESTNFKPFKKFHIDRKAFEPCDNRCNFTHG